MSLRPRLLGSVLITLGILVIVGIVLPLATSTVRFQFFSSPKLLDPTAVSIYPRPKVINVLGVTTIDYSQVDSWFPTAPIPVEGSSTSQVKYYTLSIPSLQITDIPVEIFGTDLTKNAIHFPGTTLPGQLGNAVVLGHSALPGLYKKNSPHVIFNALPKIKVGAEVIVRHDGITYKYLVKDTIEVLPDEIEVLAPTPNRRQLSLITCVPLGTYWRRFVATAILVN